MISLFVGLVILLLGVAGVWYWPSELIVFLKGFLPISFVFAGVVAILAGISSLFPRIETDIHRDPPKQ